MKSLESTLQKNGYSQTETRRIIFSILSGSPVPLTTKSILANASLTDRATVYRVLVLFEKLQIVNLLLHKNELAYELSEDYRDHHEHMSCKFCGAVIDITNKDLEKLLSKIAKNHGFTHTTHSIEINGICANH